MTEEIAALTFQNSVLKDQIVALEQKSAEQANSQHTHPLIAALIAALALTAALSAGCINCAVACAACG